jgi:hypothetical protein
MEVSQFDWLIIGVAVTELIVVIKLVYNQGVKTKLHEVELGNLKEHNKAQAEQFEELKTSIESNFLKVERLFEKNMEARDQMKTELFTEIGAIEDKADKADKATQERINNIAQAVVRVETKLER